MAHPTRLRRLVPRPRHGARCYRRPPTRPLPAPHPHPHPTDRIRRVLSTHAARPPSVLPAKREECSGNHRKGARARRRCQNGCEGGLGRRSCLEMGSKSSGGGGRLRAGGIGCRLSLRSALLLVPGGTGVLQHLCRHHVPKYVQRAWGLTGFIRPTLGWGLQPSLTLSPLLLLPPADLQPLPRAGAAPDPAGVSG